MNDTITKNATVITKTKEQFGSGVDRFYLTFEFDSKERIMLIVEVSEYGMFIKGDRGRLTYRPSVKGKLGMTSGPKYISFERFL